METSSNPIASVAEGATKGGLDWTVEKIGLLIESFKNKELAFVGDIETIKTIKDQLNTGEWDILVKYLDDPDLKLLVQMGLTLRKLEGDKNYDKLHRLRDKIVRRYGTWGLHVAQFVQGKIFIRYLAIITSNIGSIKDFKEAISETLYEIEKFVTFVQERDDVNHITSMISTRIYANAPETYIIFSKLSAVPTSEEIIKNLREKIKDYSFERYVGDNGDSIYFLNRKGADLCDTNLAPE